MEEISFFLSLILRRKESSLEESKVFALSAESENQERELQRVLYAEREQTRRREINTKVQNCEKTG